MPDDLARLAQLQGKIEEGLAAARELKRLAEEERREQRPKLRLIKGGLIWGAVLAGVEWFRNYRRAASALAVTGLVVTGGVIAEQPHSPGSDPPQTVRPPAVIRPSVPTKTIATPRPPRPQRTSPPRTPPVRARIPVVVPTATPTKTATPTPAPTRTPTKAPSQELLPTPSLSPSVPATSALVTTVCQLNLLGVKVCLPLG